jgi:hypothetical protein
VAFAAEAMKHGPKMKPAADFPYPEAGKVRVYLHTAAGMFVVEAAQSELESGAHGLSPLFKAGNDVRVRFAQLVNPG